MKLKHNVNKTLCDTTKVAFTGKFKALIPTLKKTEISQIKDLMIPSGALKKKINQALK